MTSLKLSELCEIIRESIRMDVGETYRVSAEISSISAKSGGHCYMELVEKRGAATPSSKSLFAASSVELEAKVRAVCWANTWNLLAPYFLETTGLPLQAGLQVEVDATVDFHPVYGLSLTIVGINPEYTLGGLMRQRRETIARLTEEGMMELQKALSLPTLATRVAVVSTANAAGFQDFTEQLRQGGFAFKTELFPATMQGEQAAESIIAALDEIFRREEEFDLVVIIRGGGANTDLTCFDDYNLCLYCAQFPLPILSGIGHTRDVSILDMVCYQAVKTPTAAAEWLTARMQQQADRLTQLMTTLKMQCVRALGNERHRLDMLAKIVELHSPEAIYKKGYALVLKDGKPVRSAAQLAADDIVETQFADGSVRSRVLA